MTERTGEPKVLYNPHTELEPWLSHVQGDDHTTVRERGTGWCRLTSGTL
jgi:hypothetical protein